MRYIGRVSSPERFIIRRLSIATDAMVWPLAIGMLVAGVLLVRGGEIRCLRSAADQPPECTASETFLWSTARTRFTFGADAVELRDDTSDDATIYYVRLGSYEFRTGISQDDAAAIAAEARAFASDPSRAEWQRRYRELFFAAFLFVTGLALVAVLVLLPRRSDVEIDWARDELRVTPRNLAFAGRTRVFSLREAARSEDIDDSSFVTLMIGEHAAASGEPRSVQQVIDAINAGRTRAKSARA
jgi:hypothetical protein